MSIMLKQKYSLQMAEYDDGLIGKEIVYNIKFRIACRLEELIFILKMDAVARKCMQLQSNWGS